MSMTLDGVVPSSQVVEVPHPRRGYRNMRTADEVLLPVPEGTPRPVCRGYVGRPPFLGDLRLGRVHGSGPRD